MRTFHHAGFTKIVFIHTEAIQLRMIQIHVRGFFRLFQWPGVEMLAPGGISHSGPGGNRQFWPEENSQS